MTNKFLILGSCGFGEGVIAHVAGVRVASGVHQKWHNEQFELVGGIPWPSGRSGCSWCI